ncbi:MAG: hypothetical protein QF824_06225 [Candidatus Woesearchaeota archaeon]|jgi:hypothetical protein|nr:hypothetical protein [Candidatus Woesearchaeota archaeon]MDP7457237.1 hypothetical protein [Candidatus Woesearchaeota archaeon]
MYRQRESRSYESVATKVMEQPIGLQLISKANDLVYDTGMAVERTLRGFYSAVGELYGTVLLPTETKYGLGVFISKVRKLAKGSKKKKHKKTVVKKKRGIKKKSKIR